MPYYDNPAGRLHELLMKLSEQTAAAPLVAGWANVLGVPQSDVILRIGDVADLVRQIQEAADGLDERYLTAPVGRYRDAWATPVYPLDRAPQDTLQPVLPPAAAMEALESVSAHLHRDLSEGVVPDQDELDKLREELRAMVDSVREADDLPDEVKQAIIARLLDVEKAIQLVHVGGPQAVRRATEAVMGTVLQAAAADTATARSPSTRRVVALALTVVAIFKAAPAMQNSIVAVDTIVQEITTGQVIHGAKPGDEAEEPKPREP